MAVDAQPYRAIASATSANARWSAPSPPYSSGTVSARKPCSPSSSRLRRGKRSSSSERSALARTSLAHSSITVSRSSRCRSVTSQSGSQSEPSPQNGSPAQRFSPSFMAGPSLGAQLPTRQLAERGRVAPPVDRPQHHAPADQHRRQQHEQRERVVAEQEEERGQRGRHADTDRQDPEPQLQPAQPPVLLGVDLVGVPAAAARAPPDLAVGQLAALPARAAHRDRRPLAQRARPFVAGQPLTHGHSRPLRRRAAGSRRRRAASSRRRRAAGSGLLA